MTPGCPTLARPRRRLGRTARLLLPLLLLLAAPRAHAAPADYDRDIKPLLQQRCYTCHSRLKQKGDLRLDAGTLIHRGGKHGPVVTPGKSTSSPLLQRVLATDEAERMPPEGKPLTPEQIDLLKSWIDAGVRFPAAETIPPIPAEHWAFQLVRRPAVPAVKNTAWPRNPVDSFVLAKLEARGWSPSPAALPRDLLRRLHLDLTGLPPTPAEQDAFAADPTPAALDRVIDDLLARPTHGERWARHWLDVVRYADSNGYERDAEKPFVWRYRDYVINAFNADLPFDRFVLEQLAGDELPDASTQTLIATGLQRLGHWDDEPADPPTDRFDQLDDIVATTAEGFLGLTLACARCHDHKFEPFSTRDYYSAVAVFNPLQRPRNGRTELALPAGSPAQLAALAERDRAIARVRQQSNSLSVAAINAAVQKLREATPDLPLAYFLREPTNQPPPTHVLLRGSPTRPGTEVPPAVPAVLVKTQPPFPPPGERTSQRRLALARWIASPENPLTARVLVNRVWQYHFGHGLVRTPNDFGLMGSPPTHPELLDWLADWFMRDANWSLKKLHRLLTTSATYRLSKTANPAYAAVDPENRLLWRAPLRRLEVEAIRDSMLAVSGQLNPKMFGPAMKPAIPAAAIEANTDKGAIWKTSDETETARRTIYAFIKRGLVVPMLEVLDLGDTVHSCPQRQTTTVAPQALTLFNNEFVIAQSRHLAARLVREAGPDSAKQLDALWHLTLCRKPTGAEISAMQDFRRTETSRLLADATAAGKPLPPAEADRAALEQICRAVLNLNEFVYPE